MRINVLRVSGMPYSTQIWVDDQPNRFTVYIDESLISEAGAQLLQGVLGYTVQFWRQLPASEAPTLRPLVG